MPESITITPPHPAGMARTISSLRLSTSVSHVGGLIVPSFGASTPILQQKLFHPSDYVVYTSTAFNQPILSQFAAQKTSFSWSLAPGAARMQQSDMSLFIHRDIVARTMAINVFLICVLSLVFWWISGFVLINPLISAFSAGCGILVYAMTRIPRRR